MINKMKILAALALAALLYAPQGAYADFSPVSPRYEAYVKNLERRNVAARSIAANSAEEHRTGGYIPSPLNWSHLDGKTWSLPREADAVEAERSGAPLMRVAANSEETIPSEYDLRGNIPQVRNQSAFNNCWTHSAMAATESNLIKKGLADTSIDLSEWYLTYYALNPYGDMPCFTSPDETAPYYSIGGNDWKAVALLSRGTGSVTTAKAPDITSTLSDYSQVYAPSVFARDYKLVGALYLGDFAPGKEQWEVQLSAARRDMIKRAIMTYGAVSVGIHMGDMDSSNYNKKTGAYYFGLHLGDVMEGVDKNNDGKDDIVATDHAVAIVGWDDNYSTDNFVEGKRPIENGAWIIRNSWGDTQGDGGYFYVSYEEATLCDGVAYDSETALAGENVYQYDPLGCIIWYACGDSASMGNVLYFANIFTARSTDRINSVAFFVPSDNVKYEIKVYTDCGADSPVSGNLAATQTADSLVPGYNTVALDSPVDVAEGTRFSVVVRAETPEGGYKLLAPVECAMAGYSDGATANPGEGWLSTDGVNFSDVLTLAANEKDPISNASICLKAFGGRIYTASDTPAPVDTNVTVSGAASSVSASASVIEQGKVGQKETNTDEQVKVIQALESESVASISPYDNVALLGSFKLNVAHSGGSATFTVRLTEELYFEGTPYVIIKDGNEDYHAFRAQYSGSALTFTVDGLDAYFFSDEQSPGMRSLTADGLENSSYALVTIADVRARYAAQPAHTSGGGSGGGCSAGWGPTALFALFPLAAAGILRSRRKH